MIYSNNFIVKNSNQQSVIMVTYNECTFIANNMI